MMHRLFAIVCLLGNGMGTRVEDEEEVLASSVAIDGQLARTSEDQCKENEMPTQEQNQYCHFFNANEETCSSDVVKCRWVDLSNEQNGEKMCKPVCQTPSKSEVNGPAVPMEVNNAVDQARAVAGTARSEAAEKVRETNTAAQVARTEKSKAEQAIKDAASALELAESNERAALKAQESMQGALTKSVDKDKETSAAVDAWKQASVEKQEKQEVMNAALKAKQEKEAEWKHQHEILKHELENVLNPRIKKLQQQLDLAKARRKELQKQRDEINKIEKTEGRQIVDAWKKISEEYKDKKDQTESLEAVANETTKASSQASAEAKSAVKGYWEKVDLMNEAAKQRASSKKTSDLARDAALEAQTIYAQRAEEQAAALQNEADALALVTKVEQVRDFAAAFYEQLGKVQNPGTDNPIRNVALLTLDPAMRPTLASYNVVVTVANELAQTGAGAKVLAPLKEGILKIDEARYKHFMQWCKDEQFAWMLWGANDIVKVELQID
jgi:hypothetical protein